ncbi:L-rhamnose isomerase [Shigella flexneri]
MRKQWWLTLSHADNSIRQFSIDRCKASRRVSAYLASNSAHHRS